MQPGSRRNHWPPAITRCVAQTAHLKRIERMRPGLRAWRDTQRDEHTGQAPEGGRNFRFCRAWCASVWPIVALVPAAPGPARIVFSVELSL